MSEYVTTFAVEDGRAPNLGAHLSRMRDGAAISPVRVAQIREELSHFGPGSHRAIITAANGRATLLRRVLHPHEGNILTAMAVRDKRRMPLFKGPDLGWQNQQLLLARRAGAHDALLQADDGAIVSSLRSAILLVQRDTPGTVFYSGHPQTTHSITLEAVLERLSSAGVEVRREVAGFKPALLYASEVWTMNSVFGVRRVDSWMEYKSRRPAQLLDRTHRGAVPTAEAVEAARWEGAEKI